MLFDNLWVLPYITRTLLHHQAAVSSCKVIERITYCVVSIQTLIPRM